MIAEEGVDAYKEQRAEATNGAAKKSGARPDRRAQPRLAAPLPALDRTGRPADGGPGGGTGAADRARRHAGQAADGRGQPAPRGLDRERLSGPRPQLPRSDPGGLARPDPGGGEVRLPARLQVLDLRDLVDPPGGDPGDRRQGAHDPHPGPHGGEAEPGRPRRAAAGAVDWGASPSRRRSPPSCAGRSRTYATSCASRRFRSRSRSRSATKTNRSSATSSPTKKSPNPSRKRASSCSAKACARRSTRFPSASAR